jgi:hypothetical protein
MNSAKAVDSPELGVIVSKTERTSCNDASRRFAHPITVGEFAGAKIKSIRVLRYARPNFAADPKDIPKILRNVWESTLDEAECGIVWSEATFWTIEAALDFEDGKQGLLITDGSHVALRDYESKSWFFRLLPPPR